MQGAWIRKPKNRDRRMLPGTEWAAEIERELRAAQFFVVLLSAESIRSDMVRQEVKLALS